MSGGQNKNRKLNRLSGFDYSTEKNYFVTICVDKHQQYFGGIHNGVMCINLLGAIVYRQWEWLQKQYPYIKSHTFIVMPNHVHAIIEINKKYITTCRDRSRPVPTDIATNTNDNIKIKPLSELIGAFKTTSSKTIHQNGFTKFKWQRSFYDHIIKNEKSFYCITDYIIQNPPMWGRDRNNI